MTRSTTWRRAAGALALLAAGGCASGSGRLRFECGRDMNRGLLLTVDVVRATGLEAERIQKLRERWFYDEARTRLKDKVRTLTFDANDLCGCREQEVVVRPDGVNRFLVVIGDYRDRGAEPGRGLVVLPRKDWAHRTLLVSLRGGELSVRAR
jgi:hypothetical protein